MAVRLVVTMKAVKGKGQDLAREFSKGIPAVLKEHGCEQYQLFHSVDDPDTLVLLERWKDQSALDAHLALMRSRGPSPTASLRAGQAAMEKYEAS